MVIRATLEGATATVLPVIISGTDGTNSRDLGQAGDFSQAGDLGLTGLN